MFLCHGRAGLRIGIEPMKDQSLDDPFGVRQVPGAVFLKRPKDGGIEAIGTLNQS